MTKIMLVEDDKSLREIYGVRLLAEGYDIVSAGDGEEALAMAIKERPQLIVSDVMMPKISGFDMLDILRSTTETKDIQVIMMTALSSEEQRTRGEALGADRYLVKSQVGIEDVVRVVHEVLGDLPTAAAPAAAPPAPATPAEPPTPALTPNPPATASIEPVSPTPAAAPVRPTGVPPRPEPTSIPVTAPTTLDPEPEAAPEPAPAELVAEPAPQPEPEVTHNATDAPTATDTPKPASIKTRIIQPLNDPSTNPFDINQLLDKELAKEAGIEDDARPTIQTTDQEREALQKELADFETNGPMPENPDEAPASDENSDDPSNAGAIPPPPPPAPVPPTQ